MFCSNCGNIIIEGAKFCQYCGMKTVIASKDSMNDNTVPNYPGTEYTIVYTQNGQGESRVKKLSDGHAQDMGRAQEMRSSQGTYRTGSNAPGAFESAGAYTSKVFNSPVPGVAGLREGNPGPEHSEEEEDGNRGNGILIALIVILILLILLVGFGACAYIQGLIDF